MARQDNELLACLGCFLNSVQFVISHARDDFKGFCPGQVQMFGDIGCGFRNTADHQQPASDVGFRVAFQNGNPRLVTGFSNVNPARIMPGSPCSAGCDSAHAYLRTENIVSHKTMKDDEEYLIKLYTV